MSKNNLLNRLKHFKLTKSRKNILKIASLVTYTLTILIISFLNLADYITPKKVLGAQIDMNTEKLNELRTSEKFWESFLNQNPTYLDGWIELTRIETEIGNRDKAETALIKARHINPNLEKLQ